MGKRVADSDSDDMDDDSEDEDDEENMKSAVIDNGNNSNSINEENRNPDSIIDAQLNSVSSEKVTSDSLTKTEKHAGPEENRNPDSIIDAQLNSVSSEKVTSDSMTESEIHAGPEENPISARSIDDEDKTMPTLDVPSLDSSVESGSKSLTQENVVVNDFDNGQLTVGKESSSSDLSEDLVSISTETEVLKLQKPLNFDDYNSSAEMEVLGMERLKSELQERELKCGGTLQERAARLFLLKTTPLDKLPKKLFAKK